MDKREAFVDATGGPSNGAASETDSARACPSCGYDLRGLPVGAPCPECAAVPTSARLGLLGGTLADAPTDYLLRLRRGARLLLFAGAGAAALGPLALWLGSAFVSNGMAAWLPVPAGVVGGALAWGGWIVSEPRRGVKSRGFVPEDEWSSARWFMRMAPAGWGVAWVLEDAFVPGGWVGWRIAAILAASVAMGGLAVLWWWMAVVADWANDSTLAWRLRSGLLWIVPAVVLAFLARWGLSAPGKAALVLFPVGALCALIALVSAWLAIRPLVGFAAMAVWARRNVEERQAAQARADFRRAERFSNRARADAGPASVSPPAPPPPPAEETYDLAPESPASDGGRRGRP